MFTKKLLPLALIAGTFAIGFSHPAEAKRRYNHHVKTQKCQQVVQVVRYGTRSSLKRYGTACPSYNNGWKMISKHPHKRRVGNDLFVWNDYGRLVKFFGGYGEIYHSKNKRSRDHGHFQRKRGHY